MSPEAAKDWKQQFSNSIDHLTRALITVGIATISVPTAERVAPGTGTEVIIILAFLEIVRQVMAMKKSEWNMASALSDEFDQRLGRKS